MLACGYLATDHPMNQIGDYCWNKREDEVIVNRCSLELFYELFFVDLCLLCVIIAFMWNSRVRSHIDVPSYHIAGNQSMWRYCAAVQGGTLSKDY